MSEEESRLGQQDPFSGLRQRLKNIFNSSKPTIPEDPNAISRREFFKTGLEATAGVVVITTGLATATRLFENQPAQDKFVPNFDRFEEIVPNLEVRNFSNVNVALSISELTAFLAKYGQLKNKVSILFYEGKLPDNLPEGEVFKYNLYEARIPGNAGNLESIQRKASAKIASQLYEASRTGKFQENPIAESDFEQKIQKGLLPPLVHLSN